MADLLFVETGFYLEVKPQTKEMPARIRFRCSNSACRHLSKKGIKFCAECGNAIEQYTEEKSNHTALTAIANDLLPGVLGHSVHSVNDQPCIWTFDFEVFDDKGEPTNQQHNAGGSAWATAIDPEEVIRLRECVLKHRKVNNVMTYMIDTYGPDSIKLKHGVIGYYA